MKKNINLIFLIHFILVFYSSSFVKTFGLKNLNDTLLIFFLKEKNEAQSEVVSEENYLKKLMFKELYSTFNIGLPNQNLKFYYEMNEIESSISQEFYYPKRSTTYKSIKDKSIDLMTLDENRQLGNFHFLLKQKFDSNKLKNYNSIGLGFSEKNNDTIFLSILKKKGLIKNKIFSFLFGDDSLSENRMYDGQLLLGVYPHEIIPFLNQKELNFIPLKEKEKWMIEFDSVKYNNEELKDKNVKLDVNLNIMIGPEKFRKKLISSFLHEFLENGKCRENTFISDKDGLEYIFYSFENNVQFKEIPNLFFFSKELNETFKISFSDLFIKHNEKYFFTMIFSKNPRNMWVFGQKFLNTYKFVFDLEKGEIGYYKTYFNNYAMIVTVLCIIIFGLIFGLGYLRGYMMIKNDKNFNKNAKIYPVRKEYSQNYEGNEKKEINKIIEKENKDKQKKD
mgnify:CR=1 FL=1